MAEPIPSGTVAAQGKKPWVKWVVLGGVGLVVLLAGFAAVLFFVVKTATAGPEKVVHDFLGAAGRGDYAAAHAYFSAPLQTAQPLDEFRAAVEGNAMFFKVKDTTFSQRSVDMNGAELSGTATLESGTEVPASFSLVRENGAWKLIAYQMGS